MCRSIKPLRYAEAPASAAESEAATRQFVRKVSGYQRPSQANEGAFEEAVGEVAAATGRLLDRLPRKTLAPAQRPS